MNPIASRIRLGWAALLVAMASCSGRYAVGFEPMVDASGGAGGAGGSGVVAGGGAAGSGGGEAPVDAGPPSRCGFVPDPEMHATPASSMVVFSRIHRFLDDAPGAPSGALPPQPTAAWAAEQAMEIL